MEINGIRQVLVLAPHTDDGELGAGGTIAKLIEQGSEVDYVAFSAAETAVPEHLPRDILRQEVMSATDKLGILPANVHVLHYQVREFPQKRQAILDDLIRLREKKTYDLVLTPSRQDIHQDHQTLALESVRAFKHTTVLGYELAWNHLSFQSDVFIKLTDEQLEKKLTAIAQYQSQATRAYCDAAFLKSNARVRGMQAGCEYAEAYELMRWIVD